ncbi:MAG: hypothetical protein ABSH47_23945 [Bryobacteraceae bacterium]|jgi:hypothetical protein
MQNNRRAVGLFATIVLLQFLPASVATPIAIDTRNLLITVHANTCRWSAEVKGTPMRLNDVHFLPGDDPSGWTVTSSVNNNDSNNLGSFVTVTLRGRSPDNSISSIKSPPAKPGTTSL